MGKISDVAANVSIGYQPEVHTRHIVYWSLTNHDSFCLKVWENDMIFKDQDDCSKRLLCELNAMRKEGKVGKNETVKKSDGKKLCSDGNLKRQGEQMVVVKVWCHLCNFQELSEDAKVLVDAYGENMIVFLQNFH